MRLFKKKTVVRPTTSMVHLVVRVNGKQVQKYALRAYKLESVGDWAGEYAEAHGPDAVFTINIPVEVLVDEQLTGERYQP